MNNLTTAPSTPFRPKLGQRDYQIKLACPNCGAVARMTATGLARGGYPTCRDGGTYAEAPRRVYTPRRTTAAA